MRNDAAIAPLLHAKGRFILAADDLDKNGYPETLYRKRWRLETAFQHLEVHLESEIDTLARIRAPLCSVFAWRWLRATSSP